MVDYPEGAIRTIEELETIIKRKLPVWQVMRGPNLENSNIPNMTMVYPTMLTRDCLHMEAFVPGLERPNRVGIAIGWRNIGYISEENPRSFLFTNYWLAWAFNLKMGPEDA